jgi:cell division septation protein DedD
MATTTDDGFHEIQLNGKQLVFLFMAGTVVAVVIFLLGVFVGRGVQVQASNAQPVEAEAGPSVATAPPDFPSMASGTGGKAPASASEDLSYPNRLGNPEPVRETLGAASGPRTEPVAAPPRAAAAPASQEPSAQSVPSEPAGDGYSIQLAALGKRAEAESIVRRLIDKGYSAYLMAPSAGAPAVFRVRVGKFKERREAESVSARLQKEEQFKPWIVR